MIKQIEIKGLKSDIVSDMHFPVSYDPNRILDLFINNQKSKILFLLGDIFDSEKNEDSSELLIHLLNNLSGIYKKIIFTPGNHEFRSKKLNNEKGYNNFRKDLNPNIIIPETITKPSIEVINGVKILVGNIFYDMNFLDPAFLGFEKKDIIDAYRRIFPDGKYLFDGRVDIFEEMRDGLLKKFDYSIDVIVTHSLIDSSLVKFITLGDSEKLKKIVGNNVIVENVSEKHIKHASDIGISIEDYVDGYNFKSYFMGTNILTNKKNIQEGLICLHGHSHRSTDFGLINKKVNFISNQVKFNKIKK